MTAGRIESVRIKGFRSLADVDLSNLRNANVLIGANGSGKSNFIRFFEMMSWMLRSRRLGEFVERHGGADDQLYGGNRVTPRMEAELALRTEAGRNDYRFALVHAHPDRFVFVEEAFRFSETGCPTEARSQHAPSGQSEAAIVDTAQALPSPSVNPTAYFGASGTPIPEEVEHGFRRKWNIDSGKWNTDSGRTGTSVPGVVGARR